ncbi:hypothetical protein VINE108521_05380 [Vibrio neonatus]
MNVQSVPLWAALPTDLPSINTSTEAASVSTPFNVKVGVVSLVRLSVSVPAVLVPWLSELALRSTVGVATPVSNVLCVGVEVAVLPALSVEDAVTESWPSVKLPTVKSTVVVKLPSGLTVIPEVGTSR